MATKDLKRKALRQAIDITKEYARGGSEQGEPSKILRYCYKELVKIVDEIDQSED